MPVSFSLSAVTRSYTKGEGDVENTNIFNSYMCGLCRVQCMLKLE